MENEERAVFRIATPFLWWVIYEQGQRWTILRILNLLLFLLLSPVILAYFFIGRVFSKPADRSVAEVAEYLSNEMEGRSGYRDWDDFLSIPIRHPKLEAIRRDAMGLAQSDKADLAPLLARARSLANGSHWPE